MAIRKLRRKLVPQPRRFNPGNDMYFIKNCGLVDRVKPDLKFHRGGKVGLAPDNALTRKIGAAFEELGLVTWYMNSNAEMNEMIKSGAQYGKVDDATNSKWQFCFAVTFEEQTDNKYHYNVRFNTTGQQKEDDVYDTFWDQVISYKVEDKFWWEKIRNSGMPGIINLVDNYILQDALGITNSASPNAYFKPTMTQMPVIEVKKSNIYMISGSGSLIGLTAYFGCLALFGRMAYMMLQEKYQRVSDNMKNMGMNTFTNMMAWLTFKFIQHCIVSAFTSGVCCALFFRNQHYFNVFILYFMTQQFMILLANCLQTFFVETKKGTFMSLVGSAVFFITQLSLSTEKDPSRDFSNKAALSPIAGLQLAAKILVIYEEQYLAFNDWDKWVDNFQFRTWFTITLVWCIILFFLAIWLDQVFPTEIGVKKHPCCCFGCKKKYKKQVLDIVDDDITPNEEDIEPVDESLIAQRKLNQTLSVNDLRKIYSNKKVAVKKLNIEMYSNQIFALLGENGAGKSTTISIISGLLEKTEGDINILGQNRDNDLDKIRGIMGICPQTNPVYDELTVQEHMELYYEIKTKAYDGALMKDQIERILLDIDLNHKKNYMAGRLSGGQKRKLCVAIALIGGSKILLLDEPTSGMDAYARRHLWEMLKEYKKDRLIILTTHYMDEADFLGDRIGIMKEGKLITVGSSLFLKNRYGVGYDLTILKTSQKFTNKSLLQSIKKFIPEAYIIIHSGFEVKIRLPINTVYKFKDMFNELEQNKLILGIDNFGISLSTLDQVFIKVNNGEKIEPKPPIEQVMVEGKINDNELAPMSEKYEGTPSSRHYSEVTPRCKQNVGFGQLMYETKEKNDAKQDMYEINKEIDLEKIHIGFSNKNQNDIENVKEEKGSPNILETKTLMLGQSPEMDKKKKGSVRFERQLTEGVVEKVESPWALFRMHFFALSKKKFLHFRRDRKSMACELIIPMLCILFGCLLTLANWVNESPAMMLDSTIGGNGFSPYNIHVAAQNPTEATSLWSNMNDDMYINVNTQTATTQQAFDTLLLNSVSQKYTNNWYNVWAESITTNSGSGLYQYAYTIWTNATMPHSGNLAISTINNLLFQTATGSKSNYIKHNFEPFPSTLWFARIDESGDGLFLAWLLGIAWSFQSSGIIVYVVKEREINAKHQQLVSGVSLLAYWSSSLCVDLIKYYIVMIFYCVMMPVFGISSMINGDHYLALWIVVILYGPALISFTYCLSFMFRDPGKAQTITFLISLVCGFILCFLAWLLQIIDSTRPFASDALLSIFRQICPFTGLYGVFNINNTNLWYIVYKQTEEPDALSWDISIPDIIFLCFHCWIYFALIFVIEYSRYLFPRCYKQNDTIDQNVIEYDEDFQKNEEKDADVIAEEELVKNSNDLAIKVQNLRKVYSITTNEGLCKKGQNISYKVAVKNVSFGVERGDCFCLLGTNGAGKTSCFKMLSGELLPTLGSATIKGYDIVNEMHRIRSHIGYCPQFDALFENLTAREHLELYADIKGIVLKNREKFVVDSMKDQGLTKFEHVLSKEYSGGNKRKLSVAIAQIGDPKIIYLDEPSCGMDPEARRFMWDVIAKVGIKSKQASIILTTHSMEEAEALSQKVAIMVEGVIKCIGAPQALKEKYGNGIEIECQLKLPTKEDLLLLSGYKDIKDLSQVIHLNDLEDLFKKHGSDGLIRQISQKGTGKDIWKMYDRKREVELIVLQEYLYIQNLVKKILVFLRNSFADTGNKEKDLSYGFINIGTKTMKLLEIFQSFIRIKLEGDHKLSDLFGQMEANKNELNISQYSIKQISIEQIFINLADKIQHDD